VGDYPRELRSPIFAATRKMIEHCKEILKRCGYPKEALKEEIYWCRRRNRPRETQYLGSVFVVLLRNGSTEGSASSVLPRSPARVNA